MASIGESKAVKPSKQKDPSHSELKWDDYLVESFFDSESDYKLKDLTKLANEHPARAIILLNNAIKKYCHAYCLGRRREKLIALLKAMLPKLPGTIIDEKAMDLLGRRFKILHGLDLEFIYLVMTHTAHYDEGHYRVYDSKPREDLTGGDEKEINDQFAKLIATADSLITASPPSFDTRLIFDPSQTDILSAFHIRRVLFKAIIEFGAWIINSEKVNFFTVDISCYLLKLPGQYLSRDFFIAVLKHSKLKQGNNLARIRRNFYDVWLNDTRPIETDARAAMSEIKDALPFPNDVTEVVLEYAISDTYAARLNLFAAQLRYDSFSPLLRAMRNPAATKKVTKAPQKPKKQNKKYSLAPAQLINAETVVLKQQHLEAFAREWLYPQEREKFLILCDRLVDAGKKIQILSSLIDLITRLLQSDQDWSPDGKYYRAIRDLSTVLLRNLNGMKVPAEDTSFLLAVAIGNEDWEFVKVIKANSEPLTPYGLRYIYESFDQRIKRSTYQLFANVEDGIKEHPAEFWRKIRNYTFALDFNSFIDFVNHGVTNKIFYLNETRVLKLMLYTQEGHERLCLEQSGAAFISRMKDAQSEYDQIWLKFQCYIGAIIANDENFLTRAETNKFLNSTEARQFAAIKAMLEVNKSKYQNEAKSANTQQQVVMLLKSYQPSNAGFAIILDLINRKEIAIGKFLKLERCFKSSVKEDLARDLLECIRDLFPYALDTSKSESFTKEQALECLCRLLFVLTVSLYPEARLQKTKDVDQKESKAIVTRQPFPSVSREQKQVAQVEMSQVSAAASPLAALPDKSTPPRPA